MKQPLSIALCDDSVADLTVLKKELSSYSQLKIEAVFSCGPDLLKSENQNSFDLLIIDFYMHPINGYQTAMLIFDAGFKGKILVVTHVFDKQLPSQLKKISVHGFCRKETKEIMQALKTLLMDEPYYDPNYFEYWNTLSEQYQLKQKDINAIVNELSKKEIQIIKYLAMGKTAKEIAPLLNHSPRTIESYISQIHLKSNTKGNELVGWAINNGILNQSDLLPNLVY